MKPKLLAIAASYRADSLNLQLLNLAVPIATSAGASVTVAEYEQYDAPLYRGETSGLPDTAKKLADDILAHDGIILASPEYNRSLPGGLKNLIDWLSVDKREPLKNKTALLLCASPSVRGGISGLQHLRVPLELLGMWVAPYMVSISSASRHIVKGELIHDKDQKYLDTSVRDFVRMAGAMRRAD